MEQQYVEFLRSDSMILTYEIIVLVVLVVACILLSTRKKRRNMVLEKKKEQREWKQLQEALKNERKE